MDRHDFEIRPGVHKVELRHGFTQVHVTGLSESLADLRLEVLQIVAEAGISLDFLKLTQSGLSFLVPDSQQEAIRRVAERLPGHTSVESGRSVLMVHAANMRDEEGLMASIVHRALESGCAVSHVGDMHDSLMLVIETEGSERVAEEFRATLLEAGR